VSVEKRGARRPEGEHVLALDLGTSGVCALVVGADGAVRARAWRALATRRPAPGRVEQDPDAWWARTQEAAAEALAAARLRAADLAAVGLATQRATAVAWDGETGRPLAPALGWQDTRAARRAAELGARGIHVASLASAVKLEWLLDSVPAVREAARAGRLRLGTPDVWLGERLSGGAAFATDAGQASCTGLYDLRRGTWSERVLEALSLDPAWLPSIVATDAVLAETPAALLGAPVPLAARAGDQQAAAFALEVHTPGEAKLTLGTAAMLDLHTGETVARPPRGAWPLVLWNLSEGSRALGLEGSVLTAGAAVAWLVELGLLARVDDVDAVAAAAESSLGVAFVPALQGLGTPFLDERARGHFAGLHAAARREHLVRAVLEGVAQRCADVAESLPLGEGPLRVDGGLARSRVLRQILADTLGRPLLCAAESESTALGAARLAGLAVGLWSCPAQACAGGASPEAVAPRLDQGERAAGRAAWGELLARLR
jgi:glycerol kinase